ncbi:BadF/BadG/BcrA/BcrD ATPase family protein [Pontibacter ruber]|uniref:BadF/BadG/BcrA/BcrD ATPase family protein n=1 Tax=Pontibacter ruber TaxID=1343895 RepID=A0ABW5D2G2_9BACT|nr:BadF/BadG/BcrA/BcrD ATPase family protein [Pontibacter ruber]
MILIADSGSTKTDWRILNATEVLEEAQTVGFNPMYQDTPEIYKELEASLLPQLKEKNPAQIFFYGAGCSSPERNKRVEDALRQAFPASEIHVDHDLLAAARALCGHKPGIACILGTGSNTCLYDGKDIVDNVPSLGFLLGDEGSGAYLGKLVMKAYFYREMPDELAQALKSKYNLSKDVFLDELYNSPVPSRYIATFARFAFDKRKHPVIHAMIYENFAEFFERHVCKYENYQKVPVNFVGSIAFHFSDTLKQVAKKYGAHIERIISSPSEGLIEYHQELLQQQNKEA